MACANDEGEGTIRDPFYELLSDRRRRDVLSILAEFDRPMDLAEVGDEIARGESDSGRCDGINHVAVSLYHVHAPKLADANVVEFDPASRTVALTEEGIDALSRSRALGIQRA